MKALVGDTVVAEAASEAVVLVEGNAYFPPDSVTADVLRDSPTPYTCPWKGRARYHDVVIGETVLRDGAWSYPDIKESAAARVGRDFSGYVAFDVREVRIEN
ncbi:DUF427 domain-containing protein [Streptomyces spinosisporus]|jgi:uncharacterized protein (DUF427 family)|uniref:DUF427 domain-containing protein n=1 Tax=Streptomyces spinosisporus TaxID=2927582 RepID=A0ABS9XWT1_9ACTN|nr:DUF427 domain-containing protein [Streptomyces spinosisporus]MCI3246538.1 DUF427 domain-containing protein [Streptomyces spinosisporus]